MNRLIIYMIMALGMSLLYSCDKDDLPDDKEDPEEESFNPGYSDEYSAVASLDKSGLWGPYNLHDPSIVKWEDDYLIFSTDVMYGGTTPAGIMKRKSTDLVKWLFKGWVFDGIPAEALSHITSQGQTANNMWAPYALIVAGTIRLYYSVSVFGKNISAIGMATGNSLYGPWEDQGIVLTTVSGDIVNAIDPAVIVDQETGQHWMTYGSYWSGINIVELDPSTGKLLPGTGKGKRIASRSRSGAALEGPEILYNEELDQYFLFVSYGWLEDSYNVRVGRSDHPDGPFLDYFGNDMAAASDNLPRITAPYKFNNHPGWQGFGHCGLLRDGEDYYYVSQARLANNIYMMDLHIRRILWTPDGWPVIAPERYSLVPQNEKISADLIGQWELIYLEETETANRSQLIELLEGGTLSGLENSTWEYANKIISLSLSDGETVIAAKVSDEWDWENEQQTICFSGLSDAGISTWGKKIPGED